MGQNVFTRKIFKFYVFENRGSDEKNHFLYFLLIFSQEINRMPSVHSIGSCVYKISKAMCIIKK